jgi:hypothetical protein
MLSFSLALQVGFSHQAWGESQNGDCPDLVDKLSEIVLDTPSEVDEAGAENSKPSKLTATKRSVSASKKRIPQWDDFKKTVHLILDQAAETNRFLNRYLSRGSGTSTILRPDSNRDKAIALSREILTNLNFLFPLPYDLYRTPVERVFYKLWRDPRYKPNAKETQLLEKFKMVEIYNEKKEAMHEHPGWFRIRAMGSWAAKAFIFLIIAESINHALQLQGNMVTGYAFSAKDEEKDKLGPYGLREDQIQLLVDFSPVRHLAIRIGDSVYSFGRKQVETFSLIDFIRYPQRSYDDNLGRTAAEIQHGKENKYWTGLHTKVFSRSIQAITLNLTKEEVSRLKADLDSVIGKDYGNSVIANISAKKAIDFLERNTSLRFGIIFDPLPYATAPYLTLLKTFNSAKVGHVYQIAEDPDLETMYLLRNAYYSVVEMRAIPGLVAAYGLKRAYLGLRPDP